MNISWEKVVVSVVLVAGYFLLPGVGFGGHAMTACGTIGGHLLYSFGHANVWHLLANVVCLWMVGCPLRLGWSYLVAVVCSFLPCFVGEATCGFSGMLFAMVGLSWGKVGRFKDMLWRNKWYLVVPLFVPHVNGVLHLYCLLGGYFVGIWLRHGRNVLDVLEE